MTFFIGTVFEIGVKEQETVIQRKRERDRERARANQMT